MCEDPHGCINCGCKPQFVDSDGDEYCSEECYMEHWNLEWNKIEKIILFVCKSCTTRIDVCDHCNKAFTSEEIICDVEQGKHFCSKKCIMQEYQFMPIDEYKAKRGDTP